MRTAHLGTVTLVVALGLAIDARAQRAEPEPLPPPPDVLFGELFDDVQMAELFADQKVFPDAVPLFEPDQILADYAAERDAADFDLRAFVEAHFALPDESGITPPENQSLREHIEWLWPALTRTTTSAPPNSSLVPLPEPYVVPGGRFREVYYWDSYFTMVGLAASGLDDLVLSMLDNFAHEIDRFGHIPNGNRTYYLSRSQPPFFSSMVELAARLAGTQVYATYLPELRREHEFWMAGLADAKPGSPSRNVVVLPDGTVLNRYWDARDTPRPEAWAHDVRTAASAAGRPANEVYRDLRATAESGIDFSSRWLGDGQTLATIRTTSIIAVDLNSLLFHLENTIAEGCRQVHDRSCVRQFRQRARERSLGIAQYLWSESSGYYVDYDFVLGEARPDLTAATLYPLFAGAATRERARSTAEHVAAGLLQPGGLSTTTVNTGEQWDAPNGWAPLEWVAIRGLERYGEDELAREIGTRFLASVEDVYAREGKLVEKYDVEGGAGGGGGGEYPLQDGFGWSNAVTLKLLDRYASGASAEQETTCHD
ncbi:MAG TPA: alpha,alpha-trehalase TreA [Polyangiaceae bacterium]|nr:alpha,alpha-trehalase TreA [Polyangiaceae bacterium]